MEAEQAVLYSFGAERYRAVRPAVHRPDFPADAGGRPLPAGA